MISDEIEGIQTGWMFFLGKKWMFKRGSQRTAMTGMLQVTVTSLKRWSRLQRVFTATFTIEFLRVPQSRWFIFSKRVFVSSLS